MDRRLPALVVLFSLALAGGCAHKPAPKPQATAPRITPAATATALCFDPPVIGAMADSSDLDRAGRDVEAFIGYTTQTTEAYVIRTNDRQLFYNNPGRSRRFGGGGGGTDFSQFDRHSYSERSGLLLR